MLIILIVQLLPVLSFGMDKARVETRVDEAIATFGVNGEGVLIAILDRASTGRTMTSVTRMERPALNIGAEVAKS